MASRQEDTGSDPIGIERAVTAWPGVAVAPHRFGGREFTVAGREVGHLHGTRQVDIPYSRRVRDALVGAELADPHHLFPESGWVTYYLQDGDDDHAVWLLRVAYLAHALALRRRDPDALADLDLDVALADADLPHSLAAVFDELRAR